MTDKECVLVLEKLDYFIVQQCTQLKKVSSEKQAIKQLYLNSLFKEIQHKKQNENHKATQTQITQPLTLYLPANIKVHHLYMSTRSNKKE